MSARRISLRNLVVASILGLALTLIPIASALADGTGTMFPH
jgi:hypothetical protein